MPNEAQKSGGGAPDNGGEGDPSDDAVERPTAAPPFDPEEFAREFARASPAKGTAVRPMAPTLNDPAELEEARQRSMLSEGQRLMTPSGALSLANARIPSNLPPRKESDPRLSPIEQEWVELEMRTRPPPAITTLDSSDLVDAPDDAKTAPPPEEEFATRPPPADVALLEALTRGEEAPPTRRVDSRKQAAVPASLLVSEAPKAPPVAEPRAPVESPVTVQEMNDRISLGDYSGALGIAEKLLAIDPNDRAASQCAENCRNVLRQMYATRIGPLDRVPTVMVARDQLRWLSIDHRAGFVLSLIDGVSSLEMILDVSGMPELDALRILCELAQQRIIAFR